MYRELLLTPNGRLRLYEADGEAPAHEMPYDAAPGVPPKWWIDEIVAAFDTSSAAGLFALAAKKVSVSLSPVFLYWRAFSSRYLHKLCGNPAIEDAQREAIEAPSASELMTELLSAPPMSGGEYLDAQVLQSLWVELDSHVRREIASSQKGLSAWLGEHAPLWRQVGRVCFHLAENRLDPDYPFGFLATYAPRLGGGGRIQYQPLGKALIEYSGARNRKALINLLSPIQRASERVSFVKDLVASGDIYHPLAWTPQEAYKLLRNIPLLEESGLVVRLPDWWKNKSRPRVAVTIGQNRESRVGVDGILDFDVGLVLGDERLTQEEVLELFASNEPLVLIRGQWVEIDKDKIAFALAHWKDMAAMFSEDGLSFVDAMKLLSGVPLDFLGKGKKEEDESLREWSFVGAGTWLSELLAGLRDPNSLSVQVPKGKFRGILRPYQETGRNWLWFLSRLGLGTCLADDMGLGKTIQVLALFSALKEDDKKSRKATKPSLLVLPASLIANWKSEIATFAPHLSVFILHPSETERERISSCSAEPDKSLAGIDLVLTSYGMLLRQPWLSSVLWRLVVLDEAQAIKNPSTAQTKAVKRLKAQARIALTGTPLENRLTDLWSLFDFLSPGLLGTANRFKAFIKKMEESERDRYAPLRRLVQPYILRRLKTDKSIIADLPDKIEMKAYCGLSKQQAMIYTRSVREFAALIHSVEGIKRRALVISYLLRFKQICNHPSQFLGDGVYDPADSGKFDRLKAICEELASRQEKVLVFTQFREMTEPLADYLTGVFGREGLILHGGTAVGSRKALVDRFQREDGPPFFILSIKAGGTGLNLTAASHVIHFDRWWNPAVENQATDRAFRIGQHRNVTVHKFLCRGTVEEKIDVLIEDKTDLATDILKGGGDAMLTELSNEALLDIVQLNVERATL